MTELWRRSAIDLAQLIATGQASSMEVVDAHLARIEAVNPKLNAVVRVLADTARAQAAAADRKVAAGARYAMSTGWNFTGAAYYITQNNWTIGLGPAGAQGLGCAAAGLLCGGTFREASLAVDYIINKHYDVYAGVNWSEVTNGLANGFVGATGSGTTGSENQSTIMWGFRIRI